MSENKSGFWGSPRTPRESGSGLSSPLSLFRNFASLSNRGSPQSPRTRLLNGGTEVPKTPDRKTPGGSSVDDDVENEENNDGASISDAQEVFESTPELTGKAGIGDNTAHHVKTVVDVKALTAVPFDNKAISAAASDDIVMTATPPDKTATAEVSDMVMTAESSDNKAMTAVPSDNKGVSAAASDEVVTAESSDNKDVTPTRSVLSAPELLPLLDQTATATTVTPTRYEAIASLDVENEAEKWSDRTSVITEWQHEEYVDYASEVVSECINEAVTASVPPVIVEPNRNHDDTLESEMDVSFLSTATAEASYRNVGRVIVSDDSEYESAGDASFVDTSFLVPTNSKQSSPATKSSDGMDALIDGIANFQLITPYVDKPVRKPDFGSPPTSELPDRESTPVPPVITTEEFQVENEIVQSGKQSTAETSFTETSLAETSSETSLAETSLAEISVIEIPAGTGNSNDDSFLSMFASMKVEEAKEVLETQAVTILEGKLDASSQDVSSKCSDVVVITNDSEETIELRIVAEAVPRVESADKPDLANASDETEDSVVEVVTNEVSVTILESEDKSSVTDVATSKASEEMADTTAVTEVVEVVTDTEPVVKVEPEHESEEKTHLAKAVASAEPEASAEPIDREESEVVADTSASTGSVANVESEDLSGTSNVTDTATSTEVANTTTSSEVIDAEPVVKVVPEDQSDPLNITDAAATTEPVVNGELEGQSNVASSEVEVVEIVIDTEQVAKLETEEKSKDVENTSTNSESILTTELEDQSETTNVVIIASNTTESVDKVETKTQSDASNVANTTTNNTEPVAIDTESIVKVELEDKSDATDLVEIAGTSEGVEVTAEAVVSDETNIKDAVAITESLVQVESEHQSDTTNVTDTEAITDSLVQVESEHQSDTTNVTETAAISESLVQIESEHQSDTTNVADTTVSADSLVQIESEHQTNVTEASKEPVVKVESDDNAASTNVCDMSIDVEKVVEMETETNVEDIVTKSNGEASSNNPVAISFEGLTPTVSRHVKRCFEFQSNVVSTPQDVIPKVRPSTPTKRETEKINVSPDNIKRHLFDSPAAQKPTAVVRPNSGIKTTPLVLPSHVETEQLLHINNSNVTVDAVVEPADDESKVEEKGEDEVVAPFQATGYNLDALTDFEINPFESRRGGMRNSFGNSSSIQDDEPVKETDFKQVKEAVVEPVEEPVKEAVAEPVEESVVEMVKEVVTELVEQTVVESVNETEELINVTSHAKEQEPSQSGVEDEKLNVSSNSVPATTGEEAVDEVPVGAGYNLDFLDDPNYNPFATKSAGIRNSFGTSEPTQQLEEEVSASENAPPAAPKSSVSSASAPPKKPTATGGKSEAKDGEPKEEKKKKPLPPKPWLRKKTGVKPPPSSDDAGDIIICLPAKKIETAEPEEKAKDEFQASSLNSAVCNSPAPAPVADVASNSPPLRRTAAYNLDFLDQAADDPEFNPFVTKSKVVNDIKQAAFDDPNFNPFETKSKVVNDVKQAEADSDFNPFETKSKVVNDMTEAVEDPNFNPFETKSKVVNDEKLVAEESNFNPFETKSKVANEIEQVVDDLDFNPFETKSKVANDIKQNSPPLRQETAVFNLDFLEEAANDPDFNPFATKSKVVDDLKQVVDEPPPLEDVPIINLIQPSPVHVKDSTPEFEAVEQQLAKEEPRQPVLKPTMIQNRKVEAAALSDMPAFSSASNNSPSSSPKNVVRSQMSQMTCDTKNMTLAEQELWYESQLLQRDKELHAKQMEFMEMEREMDLLRGDVNSLCKSDDDMVRVLQEFERTISELTSERERERVLRDIEKEQIVRERDQALHDLRSVERSFSDTQSRYERLREVILEFSKNEDHLKSTLERTTMKYRQAEDRYERLKSHAEAKLAEANEKLSFIQRSRESELTKLHAMQRKAEMRLVTLERTIGEKSRENNELTAICDELIAKVGK